MTNVRHLGEFIFYFIKQMITYISLIIYNLLNINTTNMSMESEYSYLFKYLIIGDLYVGKTSILTQYA